MATASRLVATGEFDQAEPQVRNLLIETPDDLAVNSLMLRVMIGRGEVAGAVSILDRMAQLNPERRGDFEAHAANLLYQSGDADGAIARLKALLEWSPSFHEARRRLSQILNNQGYTFDSNEQIRKLIQHSLMTRDELISLIFPTRAWVSMKQIESAGSVDQRRRLGVMNIAAVFSINGNPRKSLETLSESDLIAKKNPAALSLYGRTLARAQMYEELETWIASAPIECERYPDYWIAAGNLAIHRNEDAAVDCFANAMDREPHSLDAHYGMIESLESAGQSELAEKFRQRSYALDAINRDVKKIRESTSPAAQSYLDVATQLMNVGRPLEAIAWQEFALSQFTPNAEQLRLIPGYKKRVLSELPRGRDENIVFCEMDRRRLSPSEDWLVALRQSMPKLAPADRIETRDSNRSELPLVVPVFRNVAQEVGITFRYRNAVPPVEREFQIFQAFGGGVACLDYDRDGNLDFYFSQAATTPPHGTASEPNKLFRSLGGQFVDVIAEADADDRGYTFGVTAGDWNQDGFADLMIGNLGPNQLLINQGDGTFRRTSGDSLDSPTYTSSVAIADVTGDALPDIIEINYLDDPLVFEPITYDADGKPTSLPGPLQFKPAMDRLFVSTGDGSMRAQPLGGQDATGFSTGLALLVTDLDGAPGNEVFVANDLRANQYWVRHQPDDSSSQWTDFAVARGVAYGSSGKPMACMGIAAADYDENGRLDLHVTNFEDEWSNQYMQTEAGSFVDSTVPFKLDTVSRKMLGFGTQAIDYDNNTVWDLIVGNGHIEDRTAKGSLFAMPTQFLVGQRDGFVLQDVSGDDAYWGTMHFSRAMAKCDFNRDGLVDVVVTDLKSDAVLLENRTTTTNHWLQLEFAGTQSERDAIGTQVTAEFGGTSIVQAVQTGDGYLSKNESAQFFGLGESKAVDRLRVRWPGGAEQVFEDLNGDSRWLLVEGDPIPWQL